MSTFAQDVALGAAKTLMGTSPVFSTSAPALFQLYSIPSDQLAFLTFKAHSRDPYDVFPVPPPSRGVTPRQRLEATRHWLRSAKVPLVSELNAATFGELMPSEKSATGPGGKTLLPPLVGLAVLSRRGLGGAEGLERAKEVVAQMARSWVEKRRGGRAEKTEGEGERDVLWAWVDGDKWAGWARSMYDVKLGARDGPKVVIADPKVSARRRCLVVLAVCVKGGSAKRLTIFPGARVQRMEYWKTTAEGSPLELDRQAVFDVIEQGAYARRIKPESSRQFLERFAYVSPVSLRLGIYTLTVPRCRTD
jgi:protein disulfide-isomerase